MGSKILRRLNRMIARNRADGKTEPGANVFRMNQTFIRKVRTYAELRVLCLHWQRGGDTGLSIHGVIGDIEFGGEWGINDLLDILPCCPRCGGDAPDTLCPSCVEHEHTRAGIRNSEDMRGGDAAFAAYEELYGEDFE